MATNVRVPRRRSLADDLRHRSREELADLFRSRPDLLHPLPTDMADLARRAAAPGSIRRALLGLDRRGLRVASAVAAAPGPVHTEGIVADVALPEDVEAAGAVAIALEELAARALVWSDGERLHALREFRDTMERLLAPAAEAGEAPDLEVTSWTEPLPVAATAHDPLLVDRVAGQQGLLAPRMLIDVVALVTSHEPRLLRSGYLPIRELEALAANLDLPVEQAAMWLELSVMLGLIGPSQDGEVLRPTVVAESFGDLDSATAWAAVVTTWSISQRAWERCGDGEEERLEPLSDTVASTLVNTTRTRWLELFDAVAPGEVITPAGAVDVLSNRFPLVDRTRQDRIVRATASQAELLGVTGRGALSTIGRWVRDKGELAPPDPLDLRGTVDPELTTVAADLLPEPIDHVMVQADLTMVAPGPLAPDLARKARDLAEIESTGGATVYRLSVASIERALDRGWTADSLMTFLSDLSRTELPQPVAYLVADTAERHGRLRAGSASSYLHVAEPTELDLAVVAAGRLGLSMRRISETVAVSEAGRDEIVEALRQAGLPAVREDSEGVVGTGPRQPLAQVISWPPRVSDDTHAPEALVRAAVTALERAEGIGDESDRAPEVSGPAPEIDRMHSAQVQAVLASALGAARRVWIRHADNAGESSIMLVEPISLAAGAFRGVDLAQGRTRTFALSRIVGATPTVAPAEGV